jgi:hypothetical protein
MFVSYETSEQIQIPRGMVWNCHEELRRRPAALKCGDAALAGTQEFACIPERLPKRLLRVLHVLELSRQPVEQLEEFKFPCL